MRGVVLPKWGSQISIHKIWICPRRIFSVVGITTRHGLGDRGFESR